MKTTKKERVFTGDILKDYINNEINHSIYSKEEEQKVMKTLKMKFYDAASEEDKEKYLNYYMQTHPLFKEMYLNASKDKQEELLKQAKDKAEVAYGEFIKHNFRLVFSIAKEQKQKSKNMSLELMDLIAEGNIGLLIAIEKFDIDKGFKFSTYASYWIKQQMIFYIDNSIQPIRIKGGTIGQVKKYEVARKKLMDTTGKIPSNEEIAEVLGVTIRKVIELENISRNYNSGFISLNDQAFDDETTELGDFISDNCVSVENQALQSVFSIEIDSQLDRILNYVEKTIITKRYGLNGQGTYTPEEISKELGLSQERIGQIEKIALVKLRKNLLVEKIGKIKRRKK